MKFIEEHIRLKFKSTQHSTAYIQKISSEIISNGRTKNQYLEKKIHVEIYPKNINVFYVTIKTETYDLELDSTLKKQEILSKEVASIIDVVKLKVNVKGKIVTLLNHTEIQEKWHTIKPRLENVFIGEAAEKYFLGMEKKISNYDKLLSDFKQYRLFGLLWNEAYQSYSNIEAKEKTHRMDNMIFHLPLTINEKKTLEKQNDESLELKISGELSKTQGYYGEIINVLEQKYDITENIELQHYGGKYVFNTKTGLLENLNLKIITAYGKVYQKTQEYQIIKEA